MSMFDTYDNLQNNYIPNNINPCPPKPKYSPLQPLVPNKPYEDYNEKGELIGYWWNYKDILNLEFNIIGEITIMNNDIIYIAIGQEPNELTIGEINQKAYNITDKKSWTCTEIEENKHTWTLDSSYIEPQGGDREVYIAVDNYLEDKQITVQLYNFRKEQIDIKTYKGFPTIIYSIDKELSEKLVRGVYYCSLTVWEGEELNQTILSQNDITLSVR